MGWTPKDGVSYEIYLLQTRDDLDNKLETKFPSSGLSTEKFCPVGDEWTLYSNLEYWSPVTLTMTLIYMISEADDVAISKFHLSRISVQVNCRGIIC